MRLTNLIAKYRRQRQTREGESNKPRCDREIDRQIDKERGGGKESERVRERAIEKRRKLRKRERRERERKAERKVECGFTGTACSSSYRFDRNSIRLQRTN